MVSKVKKTRGRNYDRSNHPWRFGGKFSQSRPEQAKAKTVVVGVPVIKQGLT